ncbi:MAG: hypothetical protein M0P94_05050, partial [Candidatus Absconditabacterales bacterium]|nr:hypothetical protein [Candidatus Absconditabacterales bacterium]
MKREELTPDDFNKINILTKALLEKKLQHLNLWAHDVEYDFGNDIDVTTDTPNLVTSAFVINAFWDAYKKTDKIYFLNLFKASVEDLIKTIKYKEFNDNTICFFYTTITKDCIHNANLLYSELLAKYISLNTENNNFLIELLKKSIRFSLNHFDNTASIPYGIEILSVDNYHTGYVI